MQDADHEETAPGASALVISKLVCSLVGQTQTIQIMPGTLAYQAYGGDSTNEQFRCNYGLNPAYRDEVFNGGLRISGIDSSGEVRIVELSTHPFFIATLFLPQLSSNADQPHPLITAFIKTAAIRLESEGDVKSLKAE
jgi:CTP synthase (UTP-ammonia lyase)